jgi:putative ABC transport system permease protein
MFRNYFAAALRNLVRNKFYAGIKVVGLAVGFAATILIGLYVRDFFSFDTWLPNYARTYVLTQTIAHPGQTPTQYHTTPGYFADFLRQDFASVEAAAGLSIGYDGSLRRGGIEANESIHWADPEIFDLLSLPVIAGELKNALRRPDGIVLTRRLAEKYFGHADAVGEVIELDREFPMRVTAVIEDLPSNTQLSTDVIASRLGSGRFLERYGFEPAYLKYVPSYVYLRLAPGASAGDVESGMPDFVARRLKPVGYETYVRLTPLADLHLRPDNTDSAMKPVGNAMMAYALAAIGVLILIVSGINFVNLVTARAARRTLEIGVRKASGAARRDIVIQFIGEAVLYGIVAMMLACGLVELLLPRFNGFLDTRLMFAPQRDPALLAGIAALAVTAGLLAGLYPALLLSSLRPASAAKNEVAKTSRWAPLRTMLVTLQFSVLIGLTIATFVIVGQTQYALNEGLRLDKDQVVLIKTECKTPFAQRVRSLPGVLAAACSDTGLSFVQAVSQFSVPGGGAPIWTSTQMVDFGFFELYGLKPVAGRFYSPDHPGDALAVRAPEAPFVPPTRAVINETAARQLGFALPRAAIGRTLYSHAVKASMEIIGVAPDFSWDSIHALVPPSFYTIDPNAFRYLNVKLGGRAMPETLRALDALWQEAGDPRPMALSFLDEEVQNLYRDVARQGQLFAAFAAVALFLACLGLIGLAGATAERRTKEIGIRKAMGASTGAILGLFTWEFAKPVLWANLIAWPLAYYAMDHWLGGFAHHIALSFWMFAAAGLLALFVAVATVAAQSVLTARAKPVGALRYE